MFFIPIRTQMRLRKLFINFQRERINSTHRPTITNNPVVRIVKYDVEDQVYAPGLNQAEQ